MKYDYNTNSQYITYTFLFQRFGERSFWTWECERVNQDRKEHGTFEWIKIAQSLRLFNCACILSVNQADVSSKAQLARRIPSFEKVLNFCFVSKNQYRFYVEKGPVTAAV